MHAVSLETCYRASYGGNNCYRNHLHWLHILDQDSCYLASYVANKGSLNHIDPPHGCVSWITLHGRDIIVIEFSYVHGLPVLDQGSCYLASHVANKGYLNHIDH